MKWGHDMIETYSNLVHMTENYRIILDINKLTSDRHNKTKYAPRIIINMEQMIIIYQGKHPDLKLVVLGIMTPFKEKSKLTSLCLSE